MAYVRLLFIFKFNYMFREIQYYTIIKALILIVIFIV